MSKTKYGSSAIVTAGKRMYLNTETDTADVHFIFESHDGQTERIPAHKNILAATSKVFHAMFYGQNKEQGDAAAFKEFLKFFYCDEIELSAHNVAELMKLGDKHYVIDCWRTCGRFMENHLSNENLCLFYGFALLFNLDVLKKICEVTIGIDTGNFFKSPGFISCDQNVLQNILKLDSLSCTETDVFNACMAWVTAASKQETVTKELIKTHLGESFYDIRFGSMTIEEFNLICNSYETLFSTDEHGDIVRSIASKCYESKLFTGKRRQCTWNQAPVLKCDRPIKDLWAEKEHFHSVTKFETTTFSTSTTLLLRKVIRAEIKEFYKRLSEVDEPININLTIIESRSNLKCIRENEGDSNTDTILYEERYTQFTGEETVMSLSKPVIIKRGIKYKVQLEIELEYEYCTILAYKSNKVQIEPGIKVKFYEDETDGDIVGLVRGLRFNKI